MSDEGVFAVHRGVFKHPMFDGEVYTRRDAWLWLLGNAAWKATRVRIGREIIDVGRGQLAHSERFLAGKWGWSKSKVHRFLERLKTEAMVSLVADHETNLITICNYDDYQFGRTSNEPLSGPPTGPEVDQQRTKEEEGKKERIEEKKKEIKPSLRSGTLTVQPDDGWPKDYRERFWTAYPRKAGKLAAIKSLDRVRKAGGVTFDRLIAAIAKIPTADPQFIPHPATWLNQGRWDDEQIPGGANGQGRSRAFQDDAKSVSRAIERQTGNISVPARPRLVPDAGQGDLRLLPAGRGTGP
jgi:hypothetical protein